MKKILVWALAMGLSFSALMAQGVTVKTNVLGWLGCGTINAGVGYQFPRHWDIDLDLYANPFIFGDQRSAQHFNATLSGSYFFCEAFHGSYLGVHAGYVNMNAGLRDYNYNGQMCIFGAHYGYLIPLTRHWGLDLSIGGGYALGDYDLEAREYKEGDHEMFGNKGIHRWGITRLTASFIYAF